MISLVEIKVGAVSGEALGVHAVQMGWIEVSHLSTLNPKHRYTVVRSQKSEVSSQKIPLLATGFCILVTTSIFGFCVLLCHFDF